MKQIPKKKKSLGGLLTSSGKVFTAGIIGSITIGNILGSQLTEGHSNHSSANITTQSTTPVLPFPAVVYNSTQYGPTFTLDGPGACNHASGIVNGHFSQTPTVNPAASRITPYTSHANYSSHSDGGWCW